MQIQSLSYSNPSFGIKIPIEDAIQAASGRNLFGTDKTILTERRLVKQLANIDKKTYETGDFGVTAYKLSKILKENHPELKNAAKEIDTFCDNNKQTLNNTKGDISKELVQFVKNIIAKIGKNEVDVAPIAPASLGFKI